MADAAFYDDKTNVPAGREVAVRFFPNAGAAPTFVAADNLYVDTIVRTSQGLYTITLKHTYVRFIAGGCQLQVNAALGAGRSVLLGPVTNVGTTTPVVAQVFFVDAAGAVADPPAANANNSISVRLLFADIAAF